MVKALHQLRYSGRSNLKDIHDLPTEFKQLKALLFFQNLVLFGNAADINGRLNQSKQFSDNIVDTTVTSWLPCNAADPREVLRGHDDTNYIQLLAIHSQPGKGYQDQKIAEKFIADPAARPGTLCVIITRRYE